MRKTFASYRLYFKPDLKALQEHLGHAKLEELNAYVGRVNNASEKMREIFGE